MTASCADRRAWTVRFATAADTSKILALITASYGGRNVTSNPHYWQWKHERNPFGPSPVLVAESGSELIGLRAFMRWQWYCAASPASAVRAVDTATHPDWRGRKIFKTLTLSLLDHVRGEGVDFVYNTPNDKSMPGYLKMGWTKVTRLPLWVRVLRPSSFVRRALELSARPCDLSALIPASQLLERQDAANVVSRCETRDSRIHTKRTMDFLRWRYADVPGLDYRGLVATVRDGGAVAIVREKVRSGLAEVAISELLMTPGVSGVTAGRHLLRRLSREVSADYLVALAASRTRERYAVISSGFIPTPHLGPYLTARVIRPRVPSPCSWGNWRCSIGDLELF